MVRSVEDSLRRLQTDYIDLLWVHAWDDYTPYEETMRALDDLVRDPDQGPLHVGGVQHRRRPGHQKRPRPARHGGVGQHSIGSGSLPGLTGPALKGRSSPGMVAARPGGLKPGGR
jgi:hypothetical protein